MSRERALGSFIRNPLARDKEAHHQEQFEQKAPAKAPPPKARGETTVSPLAARREDRRAKRAAARRQKQMTRKSGR